MFSVQTSSFCLALLLFLLEATTLSLFAAEAIKSAESNASSLSQQAAALARFEVREYEIRGDKSITTNIPVSILKAYTGTNVGLTELVKAASEVREECRRQGLPSISVSIAPRETTNGIVTLNVFRAHLSQIWVMGISYFVSADGKVGIVSRPALLEQMTNTISVAASAGGGTNAPSATQTNTGPRFTVKAYEIRGDTLLSTESLTSVLGKYTGTNVTIGQIMKAATDLQLEYRDRGYPTVAVAIPQQQLTNAIVKLQVTEGKLSEIVVEKNRYFSSNNVMRALPSLHTNTILNGQIFQGELDRANANQDRQIYPEIEPGAETDTTRLRLTVKDRLPLHAKMDFNNQSTPGTPELRLNSSAVYNNLWQYEHSLGLQYSFSPEAFKEGDQWNFYDRPLVANYSAFYRLPLGNPEPLEQVIAAAPGSFGYNEATRKFSLPPSSGAPELNIFGSRSTIDTGVETLSTRTISDIPGVLSIVEQDVQQDLTVNNDLGFRLSTPLRQMGTIRSTFSTGMDFKDYSLTSAKTNNFFFSVITVNPDGSTNPPVTSIVSSPVPTTHKAVQYLPISFRWDGSRPDTNGLTTLGIGLNANPWFSGSLQNWQSTAGSSRSTGHWVTLNANFSREQIEYKDWKLALRVDTQWASEPLVSNEQFGNGGVNGVRGYREGEVFGDTGWRVTLDQKTPAHVVGLVYPKNPLVVRGSLYMDYGETYLLDPQGRDGRVPLWGAGFGAVASVGTHFEARFLFSWPFLRTTTTEPYQPRFDFSLSAQF
jgi:hemolysin activation/secretion protein